jgi:hypothetical protein|tara:strand:- start:225 stop:407 length:183 start_codon:yes stop_codon:yes gene_type:complete
MNKKLLGKIYDKADKLDGKLKDLTMLCDDIKDLVSDLEEGTENLSKKKTKKKVDPWQGNL